MKLSRTTLLLVAAGALIIILTSLGIVSFQQVDEQNQLNEQLALTQSNLNRIQLEKLSSRQTELESQLSQATSQFEAVKAILSQPVGSTAATGILFDVAEAYGLEVTELSSSGPATESLEGVTYSVISLTAKVEGDVLKLISFITKLNNHFTTGTIKSIKITSPETTSEEKAIADIQLVVYTHQGD